MARWLRSIIAIGCRSCQQAISNHILPSLLDCPVAHERFLSAAAPLIMRPTENGSMSPRPSSSSTMPGRTSLPTRPSEPNASGRLDPAASQEQEDTYFTELLSYSVDRLSKEPELLKTDAEHIRQQMQAGYQVAASQSPVSWCCRGILPPSSACQL